MFHTNSKDIAKYVFELNRNQIIQIKMIRKAYYFYFENDELVKDNLVFDTNLEQFILL